MRKFAAAGTAVFGALALVLATVAGPQADKPPLSRNAQRLHEPGLLEVSAAEQSDWLDENLPKLLSLTAASPEAQARIAGSLVATKVPPVSLTPLAAALAPGDLERLTALVHSAVADNPRYGVGATAKPKPTVTGMPQTHTVRVAITYPAPPASAALEPGPLTFDIWVCPDRDTALALFWCRRGGINVLARMPQTMKQRILDPRLHYAAPEIAKDQQPPGEAASWIFPRMAISVFLEKGHKPMPEDRLSFLRGNVVVEASTVELAWFREQNKWLAVRLEHCAQMSPA